VRVLIVGQDPYPTPGHAIGLCFSVAPDVTPATQPGEHLPRVHDDLGVAWPSNGDLTPWVDQGVCSSTAA
jgi:uracil-DNA glycosylase